MKRSPSHRPNRIAHWRSKGLPKAAAEWLYELEFGSPERIVETLADLPGVPRWPGREVWVREGQRKLEWFGLGCWVEA